MKQKPIISLEKNKALLVPYVVSSFINNPFEILCWAVSEQNVDLAQQQRIGEQTSHQGN